MIRVRQRWRAALRAGSLVLFVAFLPTLAYVGHWGEFTDYAAGRTGNERPADPDHASHAGHCHGASSCSDQQQPVGERVFPTVVELPVPSFIDHVIEDDVSIYSEFFLTPPTEPPRL